MKKLIGLAVVLLFCCGVNAQITDESTLAIVGKDTISRAEFLKLYNKNVQQTKLENASQSKRDYLQMYANFRLKVQSAIDAGYDTNADIQKELYSYKAQAAEPYMRDNEMAEALVKEAYDFMKYDLRAKHILIPVNKAASAKDTLKAYEQIMKIHSDLQKGMSFADVYKKYKKEISGASGRRQGGAPQSLDGDVGYFTAFNMLYPFEKAVYSLSIGEISKPVRTRHGYHIIKLTDKQPALGHVNIANIYVSRTMADTTEGALAAIKDKVDEVYDLLQKGEDFGELAKRYSEERMSAQSGGLIPGFTVDRMLPEIISALHHLEIGEYSKPVQSIAGWHIVKLLNKTGINDLETVRADIEYRIGKDERAGLPIESFAAEILKEKNIREFPEVLGLFRNKFADSIKRGTFVLDTTDKIYQKALMVYDGKNLLLKEFADYVIMKQKITMLEKNAEVNRLYARFKVSKVLLDELNNIEDKYPEFKELMQEYRDGVYLFDLMNSRVWSKAAIDTVGLENFFSTRRANYKWPQKVEAEIYVYDVRSVSTDKFGKWITKAYKAGKNKEKLKAEANKKFGEGAVFVNSGTYERGEDIFVDRAKWEKGISQDIPSGETSKSYVIIRDIIPEKLKELEEIRGQVITDYQEYLDAEWIKELRAKYPIFIDEKVLKSIENK